SGGAKAKRTGGRTSGRRKATEIAEPEVETPAAAALAELGEAVGRSSRRGEPVVTENAEVDGETTPVEQPTDEPALVATTPETDDDAPSGEDVPMEVRVAQTLADLEASTSGPVTASVLKRTVLCKDPTFSEADYGFRNF
ncbi:hypothetical protein, partial [Streptomyces sp. SID13726]|uniref:hypothetical protein n=1 Tax=Streptomyces sp. SID13726 TaxID=2706058 RepID=UPI0013BD96F7